MIEITDLSFAWPGSSQPTFEHLDWRIAPGEFVLLIGR